jgi:hypothetical protein
MFFSKSLHDLIETGDTLRVEKFLSKETAALNQKAKHKGILGVYPLQVALKNGDVDMFRFLVSKGARVEKYYINDAIWSKKPELVKLVLDHGADPNSVVVESFGPSLNGIFEVFDPKTALDAHNNFCKTVISYALQAGFDVKGLNGDSLIKTAMSRSTKTVLDFMLQQEFSLSVRAKGLALQDAIHKDDLKRVTELLESGDDFINIPADGITPLKKATFGMGVASSMKHTMAAAGWPVKKEIIRELVKHGADVNEISWYKKSIAFDYYCFALANGCFDVNDELIRMITQGCIDPVAKMLYKELQQGKDSRGPCLCSKCHKPFLVKDLYNYAEIKNRQSLDPGIRMSIICPHCRQEATTSLEYNVLHVNDEYWLSMDSLIP